MNDLTTLSRHCLSNSERWFPELHEREAGAAMHFLVGFIGEWVEYLDAKIDERAEELADMTIYWLDLCAALDVDPEPTGDRGTLYDRDGERAVLKSLGVVANKVKKWNRGAAKPRALDFALGQVLQIILCEWSAISADLYAEVERKEAICNDRWGWPA